MTKIHNNVCTYAQNHKFTFGAINLQFLTQSLKQSVTALASDGFNNVLPAKVAAVDMKKDRRDVDTSSLSMMLFVFNCNEDTDDDCCC